MAYYEITQDTIKRRVTDKAGKKRVWVEMPNGEWSMLKFSMEPILDKIRAEVDKLIAAQKVVKQEELKTVKEQIIVLEERKRQLEMESQ